MVGEYCITSNQWRSKAKEHDVEDAKSESSRSDRHPEAVNEIESVLIDLEASPDARSSEVPVLPEFSYHTPLELELAESDVSVHGESASTYNSHHGPSPRSPILGFFHSAMPTADGEFIEALIEARIARFNGIPRTTAKDGEWRNMEDLFASNVCIFNNMNRGKGLQEEVNSYLKQGYTLEFVEAANKWCGDGFWTGDDKETALKIEQQYNHKIHC